jgi:hypothetical protein
LVDFVGITGGKDERVIWKLRRISGDRNPDHLGLKKGAVHMFTKYCGARDHELVDFGGITGEKYEHVIWKLRRISCDRNPDHLCLKNWSSSYVYEILWGKRPRVGRFWRDHRREG